MIFGPIPGSSGCQGRNARRLLLAVLLAFYALTATAHAALPKRLIVVIDGIPFSDAQVLQQGLPYTDYRGKQFHRQAFHRGYFPVNRMISTFPSTSDVAWTEIFGDRPLPGYQRTSFNAAANRLIVINPLTTTMEHERQMTWQVENSLIRTLGYIFPRLTYKYELHDLFKKFLSAQNTGDYFYAYIRTTDDAQHLSVDIQALLCVLDEKLEALRARYRAQEGRELEILLISDHGNNKAGPAKRVEVRRFLKNAGYRITTSIQDPRDVVLPTTGIESWVEIHNAPAETETLAELLTHLEGVDLVTARVPGRDNGFLVLNAKGERATIECNHSQDSFRYATEAGDPLNYGPVVEALSRRGQLGADGFATGDAWMAETISHRYPLALERIVRGHTLVTMNPATILINLDNRYVHASWLIKKASEFVRFGGTHGGLDDLNSTGMLLSSFAPTQDTSTTRVAALYEGFKGLRDYRAEENGAEWITGKGQALTAIARSPVDSGCGMLASNGVYLRIWSPGFAEAASDAPVKVTVSRIARFAAAHIRRGDPQPLGACEQHLSLTHPVAFAGISACERVYALPPDLTLEPEKEHRISGRICEQSVDRKIFEFTFRTDNRAQPIAY
jgi:hypothetical protein